MDKYLKLVSPLVKIYHILFSTIESKKQPRYLISLDTYQRRNKAQTKKRKYKKISSPHNPPFGLLPPTPHATKHLHLKMLYFQ